MGRTFSPQSYFCQVRAFDPAVALDRTFGPAEDSGGAFLPYRLSRQTGG